MKTTLLMLAMCTSAAVSAAPTVSNVTMSQDASRMVTIGYTLSGEPGIVTVDIQTNGVSIGGQHLTYFAGDVNRLVQPGARTATWMPLKAWPDNKVTENVQAVVSAWATNAPPNYMVVSLTAENTVRFYANAESVPFGITNDLYKTDEVVLRKCPAANVEWRMGSPATPAEKGRTAARETPHYVTLGEDFYIGVYPVTQRQYQRVKGSRPSNFNLDADYMTRPVEKVSYEDIRGATSGHDWPSDGHVVGESSFMGVLRSFSGVDGFDLPTDAQWEFACRAGCGAALYNGQELENETESAILKALARYRYSGGFADNGQSAPSASCTAENGTAKVGSYEANDWGIYDMLGNVFEWCLDWYQESPVGFDASTGPTSGMDRVRRGGSWYTAAAKNCRCAYRTSLAPGTVDNSVGFRLACSALLH